MTELFEARNPSTQRLFLKLMASFPTERSSGVTAKSSWNRVVVTFTSTWCRSRSTSSFRTTILSEQVCLFPMGPSRLSISST